MTINHIWQSPGGVELNPCRNCREPFIKNGRKAQLQVRYAVVGDQKEKFAAKKSKYYLKHGNPHYGGTKGILTSSYRKRWFEVVSGRHLGSIC